MNPTLADAIFWICVAACAVAQFGILRATIVARKRGDTPAKAGAVHRSATTLEEILWAVLPVLALTAALVLTWRTLHAMHSAGVMLGGAA